MSVLPEKIGLQTAEWVRPVHLSHETTQSICPECRELIEARILINNGKVFMRKRCAKHGWFESLISSDVEIYRTAMRYNKRGTAPLEYATDVRDGCPEDCGICPTHKQHTCLGIVEVNDVCDLHCNTCFAGSGKGGWELTLDQIEEMLDLYVRCEGEPEVVQISGGEPTLHPDILEIIALAQGKGIKNVMLNTNGIRIAKDSEFVKELGDLSPAIYLQFDGFDSSTHEALRGADLSNIKTRAIEVLTKHDFTVVLVPTIEKGINDHELGRIVDLAVKTQSIKGVMFQPVTYVGMHRDINPMYRMTLPDILHGIEKQTNGIFRVSDFIPMVCPFPTCSSVTYAYIDDGEVTPVSRVVNIDNYLDYFKDRAIPDVSSTVREALEGLWSASAVPGFDEEASYFERACCASLDLHEIKRNMMMIGTMAFMDPYTFDLRRAQKCCISEILPDGKMIPFCVYNNLYRGDKNG